MDTLPDSWGKKVLMQHARLTGSKQQINSLFFLLAVSDFCRIGASRIRKTGNGTQFLAAGQSDMLPQLYDLGEFSKTIRDIETNNPDTEALRRFIIPGSSLGGARPKCSILDAQSKLCVAKFTSHNDSRAAERAEAVTLRLARMCGIDAPDVTLVEGPTRNLPIAVIERFDRIEGKRIPYISAQTMLNSPTADEGIYTDIADAIRMNGIEPKTDLRSLFERILFTILASNVDDHLKNHGFLYAGNGKWRLSPVFDVNPFPERFKQLKTAIADPAENAASVELLLEHAFYFEMDKDEAAETAVTMAQTVGKNWMKFCQEMGMSDTEIQEYQPAFEHKETEFAKNLTKPRLFVEFDDNDI
jgi:serine/threonine-protein kinase HipA